MKITQYHAENILNIRAVDITPGNDPAVILAGANGAGKTSILDSIEIAFGGKSVANSKRIASVLRNGEIHGEVVIETSDPEYKITRMYDRKPDGSVKESMKVQRGDGTGVAGPQAVLDGFWSKLAFDPLEFSEMKEPAQVATLLPLVKGLPFVPAELDAERATLFADRTEKGRERDRLKGQAAAVAPKRADLPAEEQSASSLLDQIAAIGDANYRRRETADSIAGNVAVIESCENEIARLTERAALYRTRVEEEQTILDHLGAEQDPAPLREQLAGVEETNAAVRAQRQGDVVRADYARAEQEYADFTAKIAAIDKRKSDGLKAATFPVDGLSFNEHGTVTYNGVPLASVETGAALRIGTAIGFAGNPVLKIVRISRGESLDSKNLAAVAAIAAEHDGQVWVEKVDESGEVGVVITDGTVTSTPASRA